MSEHDHSMRRSILIVDDFPEVLEPLVHHFSTRSPSYEVFSARDGFEAGHILTTRRIDVLLTGLHMPGMSGFQLITTVRADPSLAHVRALAMTGFCMSDTAERVTNCGALRLFLKPVVCFYWIVPLSCGFSVVVIEQTTESLPSHDRAI